MPAYNPEPKKIEPKKIEPRVLRWSREPATRLQVLAIWTFTSILCWISHAPFAGRLFEVVSAACLAFFLWPFVEGPIRLHARHEFPLHADYRVASPEPVVPNDMPSDVPTFMRKDRLKKYLEQQMQFQFAGVVRQDQDRRNIQVHIELFRHEANKDIAQVAVIQSGLGFRPVIVFRSDFQDGFAFETSNADGGRLFRPDRECPVFRFPNVRGIDDLYDLHCKIKMRFLDAHHPMLADANRVLTRYVERAEVAHQRMAQSGDYKLAVRGEYYKLTWRGAIRQAWLRTWPVKPLRALRMRNHATKMAKEFGYVINPKPGHLELRRRGPANGQPGARRRVRL